LEEVREQLGFSRKEETEKRGNNEGKEEEPNAELAPEEKAEKEAVLEEFRQGLANLYNFLPHDKESGEKEIIEFIDQTNLRDLYPLPKKELAEAVKKEKLNMEPTEVFANRGLEILDIIIHIRGLNRAAEKRIENLNQERKEAA
jgi:hypothetical protein